MTTTDCCTDRFGRQGNDLIMVRIQDTLVFNVDVEDHHLA